MKSQISLEILISMTLSLLITLFLLHAFGAAHLLITGTESALSRIAASADARLSGIIS
ncbi:MAG: hypothetical protein ABSD68_02690 [Candidatus Micrarchaeales archaeon]